jgi:hypothetical protein
VLAGVWVGCLFQKFFEVKLVEMPMALVRKRPRAPQRAPLSLTCCCRESVLSCEYRNMKLSRRSSDKHARLWSAYNNILLLIQCR